MKKRYIVLFILFIIIMRPIILSAQDLCAFEVIDNESVGLTVAPFEKFGMAVADIDRNGYPDIFCLRWKTPGYSRIYVNNQGIFQDISAQSPLQTIENAETSTRTTLWVDYDNDGDRDLSISTDKGLHLLRNDNNTFTDVAKNVGFVGKVPPGFITSWVYTIGGWADYDLDGDLDCVVAQENNKNLYLFRNDQGNFTNVATAAGLDSTVLAGSSNLSWIDIDLDGYPDLYSAYNFFRNDQGVFTDITEQLGLAGLADVGQREFFDYDNDGDLDYFKAVSDANAVTPNGIWENRDGVFVDVTADVGLSIVRDRYRGMTIGDFDNDGDKDIFLQLNIDPSLDVLLVNDEVAPGERAFADVAEFIGITKTGDRKGSVFFDYDQDGFLDIYLPSAEHNHILYHNLADNGTHWVGFMLEGTVSNRDAIGTLVTLYIGEKKQIFYTKCGNGNLRQDNPWVHFGIGFATQIDSVVIRWPLGYEQSLTDVAINQYHKIKEPEQTSVDSEGTVSDRPSDYRLTQNYPNPFNPETQFAYDLPAAAYVRVTIYDITGQEIVKLADSHRSAGHHVVKWDGCDEQGNTMPTGIYLYNIRTGHFNQTKRMIIMK